MALPAVPWLLVPGILSKAHTDEERFDYFAA